MRGSALGLVLLTHLCGSLAPSQRAARAPRGASVSAACAPVWASVGRRLSRGRGADATCGVSHRLCGQHLFVVIGLDRVHVVPRQQRERGGVNSVLVLCGLLQQQRVCHLHRMHQLLAVPGRLPLCERRLHLYGTSARPTAAVLPQTDPLAGLSTPPQRARTIRTFRKGHRRALVRVCVCMCVCVHMRRSCQLTFVPLPPLLHRLHRVCCWQSVPDRHLLAYVLILHICNPILWRHSPHALVHLAACPANKFSTSAGSSACTDCPDNSVSAAGATSCACQTGFYSSDGTANAGACTGTSRGHGRGRGIIRARAHSCVRRNDTLPPHSLQQLRRWQPLRRRPVRAYVGAMLRMRVRVCLTALLVDGLSLW
jgi:hypothetical protein